MSKKIVFIAFAALIIISLSVMYYFLVNSINKQTAVTYQTNEDEYYAYLKSSCGDNNCCLRSVESMQRGKYKQAMHVGAIPPDRCPIGDNINQLSCETSYKWCEPATPSYVPKNIGKIDDTGDWAIYKNYQFGFELKYPTRAKLSEQESIVRLDLPFSQGTNLNEKYLEITSETSAAGKCSSTSAENILSSEAALINGLEYEKQTATGVAAGNIYDSAIYSIKKGNNCYSLSFILHSGNPGNYPTPPRLFNQSNESAVFDQIMNTVKFFTPDETFSWQTYRNDQLSYTIKYPANWTIGKGSNNLPNIIGPADPLKNSAIPIADLAGECRVVMGAYDNSEKLPLASWLKIIEDRITLPLSADSININGLEGIRQVVEGETLTTAVYFSKQDKVLSFSLTSGSDVIKACETDFNNIISTFRFY